ncbi:hypothetical protein KCP69_24330 [Salmonella enterica subsp. enterica]|nr:hypothetical protein KCP69_24330 [Salmonella enterica subsp. enterica]
MINRSNRNSSSPTGGVFNSSTSAQPILGCVGFRHNPRAARSATLTYGILRTTISLLIVIMRRFC